MLEEAAEANVVIARCLSVFHQENHVINEESAAGLIGITTSLTWWLCEKPGLETER